MQYIRYYAFQFIIIVTSTTNILDNVSINRRIEAELLKLKKVFGYFGFEKVDFEMVRSDTFFYDMDIKINEWNMTREQFNEWHLENFDKLPGVYLLKNALLFLSENLIKTDKINSQLNFYVTAINRYKRELQHQQNEQKENHSLSEKEATDFLKRKLVDSGVLTNSEVDVKSTEELIVKLTSLFRKVN